MNNDEQMPTDSQGKLPPKGLTENIYLTPEEEAQLSYSTEGAIASQGAVAPDAVAVIAPAKPYSVPLAAMGLIFLPGLLFGLTYVVSYIFQLLDIALDQSGAFALSSSSFLLAALLYILAVGRIRELGSFLKLRGFRWVHIAVGLGGAVAAYMLAILVGMFVALYTSLTGDSELGVNTTTENIGELSQSYSPLVLGFLIAILAPFAEEIFFRGAMLSSVVQNSAKRWIRVVAVVLVSLAFALFHLQQPTGTIADLTAVLTPGIVGLVAVLLTLKFDTLYPAIFTHVFYNGVVLAVILSNS